MVITVDSMDLRIYKYDPIKGLLYCKSYIKKALTEMLRLFKIVGFTDEKSNTF